MTSSSAARQLPAPRAAGASYRIAVVCLGNICRSPIGEVVLTSKIEQAGLAGRVEVVSAGTGAWHVGNRMDRRAAAVLTAHGYDASGHRAKRFEAAWFDDCDLVLAMDADNLFDIRAAAPDATATNRVALFREFDPSAGDGDLDVPDPYYGGDDGFDTVLTMVERTAAVIVATLDDQVARH
jgi:protein-tyrosine phosphatase